jgi:hypothetical protein
MLKPDLPKRLAALREKGGLKISFRFEKNLTVSSADKTFCLSAFIRVHLRFQNPFLAERISTLGMGSTGGSSRAFSASHGYFVDSG